MTTNSLAKARPTVSVILTTYKEPVDQVNRALNSILNQSFSDFELLAVIDNPCDKIITETFTKAAQKDQRIQIIKNEINLGLVGALNKAIDLAHGDYICRMDADDISKPNRIEDELNYLKENNLDLVGGYVSVIDEKDNILYSINNIPTKPNKIAKALAWNNCVPHPSWFGKRTLFKRHYRDIPFCEDYDFLLRAVLSGARIGNVPKQVLYYRMSVNSISRTHLFEQYCAQRVLTACYKQNKEADLEKVLSAIRDKDVSDRARKYSKAHYCFNEGLAELKQKRYFSALKRILPIPFISPAYVGKIIRLVRAAFMSILP